MRCFQELADFEKLPDEPKIDENGQYNLRSFKILERTQKWKF
jgi:hypothetical protein